jgi:hypothetical protein
MNDTEDIFDDGLEGQEPEAPPSPAEDIKAIKSELASLRAQNAEIRESERVWAERALNGNRASAQPEPQAEPISGEAVLEAIEADGVDGLKKLGFVSAAEVRQMVSQAVGAVKNETTILSQFPELSNPKSEFYQKVNVMLASPEYADVQGPGAIRLAAKQVRESMKATGDRKSDIEQRLSVQSGVRDSAPASPTKGVTATAEQLDFATRMGVTPKQLAEQLRSA